MWVVFIFSEEKTKITEELETAKENLKQSENRSAEIETERKVLEGEKQELIKQKQVFIKMLLNMPVLGVVCEPKPTKVKKYEFFTSSNVNNFALRRSIKNVSQDFINISLCSLFTE